MIDEGFQKIYDLWTPILDVFDECAVKFALEVHPTEIAFDYYTLAQDFSIRYMLVDRHGNFGSVDGDGAAAMRYTEARMTPFAMEMLRDIEKETVEFKPNFDEEEKEPTVLPARFPNLLVNGSNGIAVGMATSIPPHNLAEVIDGCQGMLYLYFS